MWYLVIAQRLVKAPPAPSRAAPAASRAATPGSQQPPPQPAAGPPVSASSLGCSEPAGVSRPASECGARRGLLGGCAFRMQYEGSRQPWGTGQSSSKGGYRGRGLCRGREKMGVLPMTCFRGTVWWGRGMQGGAPVWSPAGCSWHTLPPHILCAYAHGIALIMVMCPLRWAAGSLSRCAHHRVLSFSVGTV